MKKIQIVFLGLTVLSALAITISSCGAKENQAPVIDIEEPADNATVTLPDSLHIEFTATDDESLHEMSVLIIQSTGDTVFRQYPMVHDLKTYTFHAHFPPASTGSYTLQVTAEDHDSESSSASRSFTVN